MVDRVKIGLWVVCLSLAAGGLGGCNILAYPLCLIAPDFSAKTVKPEFGALPGKTIAVVIVAEEPFLYEHPFLRLSLSSAIGVELERHLKGAKVVRPDRVIRYQDDNLDWQVMARTEFGKQFDADFVLQVTMLGYTTAEPGSASLYQGRITAEAELYQTSLEPAKSLVWRNAEISIAYPDDARGRPAGQIPRLPQEIRNEIERRFAEALVKKFRKHKLKAKR